MSVAREPPPRTTPTWILRTWSPLRKEQSMSSILGNRFVLALAVLAPSVGVILTTKGGREEPFELHDANGRVRLKSVADEDGGFHLVMLDTEGTARLDQHGLWNHGRRRRKAGRYQDRSQQGWETVSEGLGCYWQCPVGRGQARLGCEQGQVKALEPRVPEPVWPSRPLVRPSDRHRVGLPWAPPLL
jgi:hypothetical protein